MVTTIVLPWPPSVNSYYRSVRGRNILSKRGRMYRAEVQRAVRASGSANKNLTCRLDVEITLHPPDRRRRDVDNTIKAMLDGLQKSGVFLDDSQVDRLLVLRSTVEPGGVAVVKIKEWRGE